MCIRLYVTYLFGVVRSDAANHGKTVIICINIQTPTHQVQNYYLQNIEQCFFLISFCKLCAQKINKFVAAENSSLKGRWLRE